MKSILPFLLFIPILTFGQPDSVSLPMKGRIVFYETTLATQHGKPKEILNRSSKWLDQYFKEVKETRPAVTLNDGKLKGTGIFKIVANDAGDYYWLKFSIALQVTDSACVFQAYDFYEKPTFKGVTNDYSKIEYRWRDFKKGKPWSTGDARLFSGVDEGVKAMIKSYSKMVSGK